MRDPARHDARRPGHGEDRLSFTSLADACRYLFPRNARRIKWGLDVTEALLAELGHPEREWRSVHVGGTNGKGSVAAMVAGALQQAGWRVGLYSSPHLVSVTERATVNGVPMTDDTFVMWVNRLRPVIEATDASFFEVMTAIAFADFAARQADVCVVEVGLGGRLDCTNVLTPAMTVVTRIGLDHEDYLGRDLEGIAREKAGIAKDGVPFVTAEPDAELRRVLYEEARQRGGHIVESRLLEMHERARVVLGARWDDMVPFRQDNLACAIATLESLTVPLACNVGAIRDGVLSGIAPGRFDRRGKWLLDAAHNPQGVEALLTAIRSSAVPRPIHAVVGVVADKRWEAMLTAIRGGVDRVWVCVPDAIPEERQLDRSTLERCAGDWAEIVPDLGDALRAAECGAGTVLVTGSMFTIGEAMTRLPAFSPAG